MQDTPPPSRAELLALSSATLRPRSRPYLGDSVIASIASLHSDDAAIVRRLYAFLGELYGAVDLLNAASTGLAAVRDLLARSDYAELGAAIRRLGAALSADATPLALRKAYHDVRGGSLPALLMHLDLVEAGEATAQDIERIFILVRDHLKILRNALPDLDPAGYERDLCSREHDAALIVQKWSDASYGTEAAHRVMVHLDCEFVGGVSERCMEFAALDRVIYNLINNAARFADDARVLVHVFPLTDARETDLRFVVCNRISAAHRDRLLADLGGDCSRVFAGGYTTGGHGVGLQICGDIITHGYGLASLREALSGGYLGARVLRDHFVAWFHWPARRADAG